MSKDINAILKGWEHVPAELRVRKIDGKDGRSKVQIRMDLGLMQLEWSGRPDASQPHGCISLLDYYQEKQQNWEVEGRDGNFTLSRQDCWGLAQEAMQYYWRRISFFELKEFERAEEDAEHNLAILDMCQDFAECEEDQQIARQYRVFVKAHRVQARALALLEHKDYDGALTQIREGIQDIEATLECQGQFEHLEESPELRWLKEWEGEVEGARPRSLEEQLSEDLQAAVEQDKFELAASLRDRLRVLGTDSPAKRRGF
jgi:hypothetical protein